MALCARRFPVHLVRRPSADNGPLRRPWSFVIFTTSVRRIQRPGHRRSQGRIVPAVAERPDAAREGAMAGATREGGAVSEQGTGRDELP